MELWDLYDVDRKRTEKTHIRGVPMPNGYYHLVVHVWIQNDNGGLLLSKRHPQKHYGNLWECTGGSILKGENSLQGALRETDEELGLTLHSESGTLLHSEVRNTHHLDNWLFVSNVSLEDLHFQADEVIDAKWVNRETYEIMIRNNEVVPSLHHFYDFLLKKSRDA